MILIWWWLKRGVRQGELESAHELISMVELREKLVTGDALYCQRRFCEQVVEAGGDYLVIVKANQAQLYEDIRTAFELPVLGERYRYAESEGRHGDRHEHRQLWATGALVGYLDWPQAQQVCKVEREVERRGEFTTDVRYAITSSGAGPKALLKAVRGHWKIENRLHYIRDVTMAEDASQVRSGSAPQVMAVLRNVVLGVLRHKGVSNIAAAIRDIGWKPTEALRVIGIPPP